MDVSYGTAVVADWILTVALCISLARHRRASLKRWVFVWLQWTSNWMSLRRTGRIIRVLMIYSINTGALVGYAPADLTIWLLLIARCVRQRVHTCGTHHREEICEFHDRFSVLIPQGWISTQYAQRVTRTKDFTSFCQHVGPTVTCRETYLICITQYIWTLFWLRSMRETVYENNRTATPSWHFLCQTLRVKTAPRFMSKPQIILCI